MMQETTRWERYRAWLFYCFPHHWVSRLTFFLARLETPLVQPLVRLFVRRFDVDLSEAEETDAGAYASFDAFFTRRLRPGARAICTQERALAAPCDGTIVQIGNFEAHRLVQAKDRTYDAAELLGPRAGAHFERGGFCAIYLSPADCHRVHMPATGVLEEMIHVPGRLFSVAPYATRTIPRLYARNERVACVFDGALGKLAVVMIGAVNVGAIETAWHGLVTPRSHGASFFRYDGGATGVTLERGQELGCFHLGSTVVLLTDNRALVWNPLYLSGVAVKMGCELGCVPES